jgi:hypothetical protein
VFFIVSAALIDDSLHTDINYCTPPSLVRVSYWYVTGTPSRSGHASAEGARFDVDLSQARTSLLMPETQSSRFSAVMPIEAMNR